MPVLDLAKLVAHKKEGYYPSFIHYSFTLQSLGYAVKVVYLPTDTIYIAVSEKHDVESEIFERQSFKDGKLIFPKTVISGDLMEYIYTEPFIIVNELRSYIRNTDNVNAHTFKLTIYLLVCSAEKFEKEIW